ncbi:hypothetical protein PL321_02945 [Caloramator sp. mosi_1]|nr:hypothetical protein [Caloramator sp. mosi_1]WDC84670.1 hypothetical protein PL321_02945 [Caloramator sp. mosi_1]
MESCGYWNTLLGGWDNKTFLSPEQEKTLYIRCFAILGGVEIKIKSSW